jgi:hypothetical protein
MRQNAPHVRTLRYVVERRAQVPADGLYGRQETEDGKIPTAAYDFGEWKVR